MQDATNSKGIAEHTDARAFGRLKLRRFCFQRATGKLPASWGTLVALLLVYLSSSNASHHHPIPACAHSCLASEFVGPGVGVCSGFPCVVSSGVVDDEDDACMDGTVTDVIPSASNSELLSFSEYHDDSCTRPS